VLYGGNFNDLLAQDPKPQLGLLEVTPQNRFFLPQQLNLLGAHTTKIEELWGADIVDLNELGKTL
jgi:hypothetical protein